MTGEIEQDKARVRLDSSEGITAVMILIGAMPRAELRNGLTSNDTKRLKRVGATICHEQALVYIFGMV